MIPFFRKIRKKLADDNKPMRYMRYAIGEIVLVVVGILIALQINIWNESRKQNNELNEYLVKIAQNIKEDVASAIRIRGRRDTLKMNAEEIRIMILKEEIGFEKTEKSQKFFQEFYFIPNTSGYEALKSSGYLGRLKNNKLDSLLHNYYTQIDVIKFKEKSLNEFIESMQADFSVNHSYIKFKELLRLNSIYNVNSISLIEEKLSPYVCSKSFQAVVARTSAFGTKPYGELINIGKAYVDEVEGKRTAK